MRSLKFVHDEIGIVRQLPLITAKPVVYACNLDADSMQNGGNELSNKFKAYVEEKYPGTTIIMLSALLENEIV